MARGEVLPFEGRLGDFIAKVTIIVPRVTGPARPPRPSTGPTTPTTTPVPTQTDPLRERLDKLATAHHELTRLALDSRSMTESEPDTGTPPSTEPPRSTEAPARVVTGRAESTEVPTTLEGSGPVDGDDSGQSFLTLEAASSLSAPTQAILQELRFPLDRVDPFVAVALIENEMAHIGSQLAGTYKPPTQLLFGSVMVDTVKLKQALGFGASGAPVFQLKDTGCGYKVGIGDLLMVEQKLKAYEVAEFAHVENVLAGEGREREHRRLDLSEVIETTETESEIEKERDLQSTERNELQSEAAKTVKDQFKLDAGLQVSGSYGPTISFTASLNASYSTSVEETQKKATSYSREVTERSAERTRERVRKEVRRRVLHQIEEINKHKIDNPTPNHVRGIYRWLNKIYDAQVFNYGKRMMYEFVVPEPAAFFLWALVDDPPADVEIKKPEPPLFPISGGAPLQPSHLTRTNYQQYVAAYEVANVPPPPPQFQFATYFDKQDGDSPTYYGRAGKIDVPDGYAATSARVHSGHTWHADDAGLSVLIGGKRWKGSKKWLYSGKDFVAPREKELAITYMVWKSSAFAIGIDVRCTLTTEGFAKWQHTVYDAIMAAYHQQKAVYEDRVAQAKLQQGPQVFGRNPLENRRMERDELKKLAIEMLIGNPYLNIDSIDILQNPKGEPVMDLSKTCPNGSFIRFFENAFEWNNILYVLYPYFWSRHVRWTAALHLADADPDFAAFLKAGAARVQVPVRPGFERAVAHFCQFGEIWEGHDAPLIDDDLYVPIVDEITESLGKPEDPPEPYPADSEPWEVTIPTALVIVQNLEEVPNIRDILTGNPITVVNNV